MTGYVDLHAHVLPSVDDGPASLADAIDLLSAMTRTGVTTVVATSHVSASYPNSASLLRSAHERVAAAAMAGSVPITIVRGAEIAMDMAMSLAEDDLRGLRIGETRWLLVETPHARHPAGLPELVRDLRGKGFEVLIAHPERNPHLQENHRVLHEAVAAGGVAQITGASVRGALGRATRTAAWRFLEAGLAHLVASDAHNTTSRPPDASASAKTLRSRYGAATADALSLTVPRAILDDASAHEVRDMLGDVRRRPRLGFRR